MDKDIKVLIVDDEADFRQVMTVWLESKGYSVIAAANGKDAISMVKRDEPNIIFMDLRMPIMDGSETIKRIRRFNRHIPIIIISAYVNDPKMKEVRTTDISGIFYKSDDFEKGRAILEAVLRTHKKLKKTGTDKE
ncbi:MAG: response regulator [Candidatus Omnitrophota bacterium]